MVHSGLSTYLDLVGLRDCTERGEESPNLDYSNVGDLKKDVVGSPPFPTITHRPKQPLKAD